MTTTTNFLGYSFYDPIIDVTFTVVSKGLFNEEDQIQYWEVAADDVDYTVNFAEQILDDFVDGRA